jgi:ribosome-associated toxin RatA of RatAB toxin-antitoxin module
MTTSRTSIDIAAPAHVIYELGSQTQHWPAILPHYRYVRVLEDHGDERIVAMSAWRHVFPLRWVAEQRDDATEPRIRFRHIKGPTRGMDVEWTFASIDGGTRVTIEHRLTFAFPIARSWIEKHIVCAYFIEGVAAKTLARIKAIAEAPAAHAGAVAGAA